MDGKTEDGATVLEFPVWLGFIVTCTVCWGDKVLSKEDASRVTLCSGSTYYFSCEKCRTDTHFNKSD